jgi:hypothetical protein
MKKEQISERMNRGEKELKNKMMFKKNCTQVSLYCK